MANDVEEAPDAWVGVSPEYQNYSEVAGKPFAAPGEGDPVYHPVPEVTATVNPDGSPAGEYANVLAANAAEENDEVVAVEETPEEDDSTAPPVPPVPPVPGE